MIDFLKKNKIQLLILFGFSVCLFIPYILNLRIFIFNADQQLQYNYFYEEWMRMLKEFIKTGTYPFYSFNTFLGSNFYASKLYYLTGDIFFPIMILLSKFISDIQFNLELFTVFYVFLSSVAFYIFLYSFEIENKWYRLIGAILYSFCGIASNYVGQYMFHRFYCMLPFLFASIEYYRKTHKTFVFVFFVFVLMLSSYYFMFPTSLFLFAYCLFTIFYHSNDKVMLKSVINFALPLIAAYLIGLALSAFLTFPGVLFVKDNSRLGANVIETIFEYRVYLGYIVSFITAPLTLFSQYDYLFSVGFNGHLTWYSIYAGSGIVPFIFATLFIRNNRRITSLKVLLLLVNIFALIPLLSSLMHGLSEPSFRWMFLVTFLHILSFIIILKDKDMYKKEILKGAILYIVILCLVLGYGYIFKEFTFAQNPIHFNLILGSFILFLAYIYFIRFNKINFILIVLVFEIVITFSARLWILSETYYDYTPSLDKTAIKYFDDIDEDLFYRIYVNPDGLLPTSTMNLNQSINMDYYSTSTYDSTYEYNLKEFLQLNNINWHIIKLDNPDVLRMLGIKYYYVTDKSELPKEFNWSYEYNINHYEVYKMKEYRPLGFTYNQFINETDANLDILDWNTKLIVPNDLYRLLDKNQKIKSSDFKVLEFGRNRIYGNIELDSNQVLFFSIPYSSGWRVTVDNVKVETYKVQGGFLGVALEEGYHDVTLQFTPPGFKIGVIVTGIGVLIYLLLLIKEFKFGKKRL